MGAITRTRVIAVVCAVIVLAGVALVATAATTPPLVLLIPAYYPATASPHDPWATVPQAVEARGTTAIEIMDPDNGPGTRIGGGDPTVSGLAAYRLAIRRAHTAGSSVFGYVWTDYANKGAGPRAPISLAERQIRQWSAGYPGLDGIFLDGVSSGKKDLGFYRVLDRYARARRLKVIFNPGTVPDRVYMTLDPTAIMGVFEGSSSLYFATRFPSWMGAYPASRFANLIYGAGTGQVAAIAARARREHVGNLFVTNLGLPNPYYLLPRYFLTRELPALSPTRP